MLPEALLEVAYRTRLQNRGVPVNTREALIRYLLYGIPPGHFLEAVLANDLTEAARRCDPENEPHLVNYVRFLYAHAPAVSWGTPARVWTWMDAHAQIRAEAGERG